MRLRTLVVLIMLGASILAGLLSSFHPADARYRFPFDTHKALSGTFGELRNNHFHSGIDIKTHGKTGIPVHAIADGWIYRLRVGPFGFGKAVYLRHPDGKFSVYAHLDRFQPSLTNVLRDSQYLSEQFDQDLYLPAREIMVKQGEVIGYSGNSGSSLGPHLHFEIRDPDERILNPLNWFKEDVPDTRKPVLQNISFVPFDMESRVEGKANMWTKVPRGSNGSYSLNGAVKIRGRVGLAYKAYDLLNAAGNHCGINNARLYLDDQLIHSLDLKRFSFDETRYINVHMDYKRYKARQGRYQRAYIQPGNLFSAYGKGVDQGLIRLTDDEPHILRLELEDVHGNESVFTTQVIADQSIDQLSPLGTGSSPAFSFQQIRDYLKLSVKRPLPAYLDGVSVELEGGRVEQLKPAYAAGDELVFLYPLARFRYPTRIFDAAGKLDQAFFYRDEISTGRNNIVSLDELELFFPMGSLYDRVHLEVRQRPGYKGMLSDRFLVGDANTPVYKPYLVSFKAGESGVDRSKWIVVKRDGREWEYIGSTMGEDDNVYATIREFGEFALMADSVAPSLRPVNFGNGGTVARNQSKLVLFCEDKLSGFAHTQYRTTLDDQWVPFEYDYKANTLTYRWDARSRPGPGTYSLCVSVSDKTGNNTEKTYRIRF